MHVSKSLPDVTSYYLSSWMSGWNRPSIVSLLLVQNLSHPSLSALQQPLRVSRTLSPRQPQSQLERRPDLLPVLFSARTISVLAGVWWFSRGCQLVDRGTRGHMPAIPLLKALILQVSSSLISLY